MRGVIAVCLLMLSPVVYAGSLELYMNNTAFQVRVGETVTAMPGGNAELIKGLLFNDKNNLFGEVGLRVKGPVGEAGSAVGNAEGDAEGESASVADSGAQGLSAGGGIKGVFGVIHGVKTSYLSCIALGTEMTFSLSPAVPISLSIEYYTTLKILTFLDADRFNQLGLRLEVVASPQAKIFWTYRDIAFSDRETGGATLENSTFIGILIPY